MRLVEVAVASVEEELHNLDAEVVVVAPWEERARVLHEDPQFEFWDLREVELQLVVHPDLLPIVDHCLT
jgi:hypothetical protein